MANGVGMMGPKDLIALIKKLDPTQQGEVKQALGITGLTGGVTLDPLGGITRSSDELNQRYQTQQELLKQVGTAAKGLRGELSELEAFSKDLTNTTGAANEAIRGLGSSMQSLTFFTSENVIEFGKQAIVLNKLGVSYTDFGQILDTAAMAFGANASELTKLGNQLGTLVSAFPGQASTIARNFQKAQSSLAYNSGKIMDVFKKLQATSSATGVSFDKLTSAFGDSMDTFQGSSQKAGTLNAILGKNVFNSIDLLGKSEEERVETVISGLRRNMGGSVNQLGKFQLKAIAQGLGLGVEDTRRLLSGETTVDKALASKETSDPRVRAQQLATQALNQNTSSLQDLEGVFKETLPELQLALLGVNKSIREGILNAATGVLGLNSTEIQTQSDIFDRAMQALGTMTEADFSLKVLQDRMNMTAADLRELKRPQGGSITEVEKLGTGVAKKVFDAVKNKDLMALTDAFGVDEDDSRRLKLQEEIAKRKEELRQRRRASSEDIDLGSGTGGGGGGSSSGFADRFLNWLGSNTVKIKLESDGSGIVFRSDLQEAIKKAKRG